MATLQWMRLVLHANLKLVRNSMLENELLGL